MKHMAYYDTSHDMPEEVLAAAGFVPYKILGDIHASLDPADQFLPKYFCPFSRSAMTEALAKSGEWAGIVFAHGCDTTNRHHDVWREHVDTPFLYWFNSPVKNDATALTFKKGELKRLIAALSKQFSITISDEDLKQAIRQSNQAKALLRQLAGLRSTRDIPNRDYLDILKKSMQMPYKELIGLLEKTLDDWQARAPFPSTMKRFLLTGSDVTFEEWMDILDEAGIRVVRDDLAIGERYFTATISENDDPIHALADYYLNFPRPATKVGIDKRIDFLLTALSETPVDAVLSQNLKFCEPYALDAVTVNSAIKEKGHRIIHLEREYTAVSDQQLTNRLHAFIEMI